MSVTYMLHIFSFRMFRITFICIIPDPFFLPMQQVDKGAIRFVLSGANIMCPGLTSPGAKMSPVDKGTVVAIMAEGKQHALAIGFTTLSTDDM